MDWPQNALKCSRELQDCQQAVLQNLFLSHFYFFNLWNKTDFFNTLQLTYTQLPPANGQIFVCEYVFRMFFLFFNFLKFLNFFGLN